MTMGAYDLICAVDGAVIDNDDFEIQFVQRSLFVEACECAIEAVGSVERADNYADKVQNELLIARTDKNRFARDWNRP